MRPSNLQLKQYMVSEISVTANKDFNPDESINFDINELVSEPECILISEDNREWQVVLRLKHSQSAKSNSPYSFLIELVGFFSVNDAMDKTRMEQFVKVNGSSVLYSTGREVLRSIMSMGPYLPIMLPTVCFFDPKHKTEYPECTPAKSTK